MVVAQEQHHFARREQLAVSVDLRRQENWQDPSLRHEQLLVRRLQLFDELRLVPDVVALEPLAEGALLEFQQVKLPEIRG